MTILKGLKEGIMMKRLLIISLLFFFHPGSAQAFQEIVAVQSVRIQPYEEAIKGFASVCHSRLQRFVISESEDTDVLREIKRIRPKMVLAVGRDALSLVKSIKNIPIVYLMVLNPQSILSGEKNISGVSMRISPEKQLRAVQEAVPKAKRIGLVYDPTRTGPFVRDAQKAAAQMGLTLIAREVHSAKKVPSLVTDMKHQIDLFWMLPDATVVTGEVVEFLLLFSLENNIPLLTFSEKYLEMGAFMSTGIDPFDMGAQAGDLANKILQGKDAGGVKLADARRMVVSTNLMIAGKLGIALNTAGIAGTGVDEKIIRSSVAIN
jgi:putative ABC transport system substrate-binding protein